jgi:hypothetical protein
MTEHDVLYHPSHFELTPESPLMGYFDTNCWYGAVSEDCYYNWIKTSPFGLRALAMSFGYAEFFLEHMSRLAISIWNGLKSQITPWDCTTCVSAEGPSVNIRHGKNLTKRRWSYSDTRVDSLPPWGKLSEALECQT